MSKSDELMEKMRRKSSKSRLKNNTNDPTPSTGPPPRPMHVVLNELRQSQDPALVYSSAHSQLQHLLQDAIGVKESPLQQYLALPDPPVPLFPYQDDGARFIETHSHGLLCDEMGLGKTRQVLCAIHREQRRLAHQSGKRFNGATLILGPKSVLDVWLKELAKFPRECFVVQDLRQMVPQNDAYYYGECDLILCSYPMLRGVFARDDDASLSARRHTILYGRMWPRVYADEAHAIVVEQTLLTQAVRELKYRGWWHITGTPLKNELGDLRTLIALCGETPSGDEKAVDAQLQRLMLRRTKLDLLKAPLAPADEALVREPIFATRLVEFATLCERMLYCCYAKYALRQRRKHRGNTPVLVHYLRQLCLAPALVKGLVVPPGMHIQGTVQKHTTDMHLSSYLVKTFRHSNTKCEYRPGASYVDPDYKIVARWNPTASLKAEEKTSYDVMLREWLRHGKFTHEMASVSLEESRWTSVMQAIIDHTLFLEEPSSMERALLEWTQQLPAGDQGVLVAMSVGLLNRLHGFLQQRNVPHALYHSKLGDQQNAQELRRFESDPSQRVLLLSLKKGGTGLNLQCANHMALLPDWWGPTDEQQALARVLRPGQKKQVHITRFAMRSTVQAYVTRVQQKKQDLIERLVPTGGKNTSFLSEQQEGELFDYTVSYSECNV